MSNKFIDEIQSVVDRLHQEGNVIATKLENALLALKGHFEKNGDELKAEAETDAAQVEKDAAPVVAEAKADGEKLVTEAKADAVSAVADAAAAVKK